MMVWTPERRRSARATCKKWAGIQHLNRRAVPGIGIDCVNFVLEVLFDAGVCERRPLPFYDERLGSLRDHNVIEDLFVEHFHAAPAMLPIFGDIVVCKCGRQTNHVGIMIDGMMWHVPGRGRVGPESWDAWSPRVQSLVRLEGTGYRNDPSGLTWDGIKAKLPA